MEANGEKENYGGQGNWVNNMSSRLGVTLARCPLPKGRRRIIGFFGAAHSVVLDTETLVFCDEDI